MCGRAEERFGVQVVIHHVHVILQIDTILFITSLSRPKNITKKKNTTKNSLSILIIQRRFFKGGILREKKIDKNANFSIIWAADDALKFRCSLEVDKS